MRRRSAALSAGLIACFGTAAGHAAAYFAVHPRTAERAALLEATGHGYWSLFLSIAAAALVAGFCGAVFWGYRRAGAPRLAATTLTLGLIQSIGFVLLESAERVVSGHAAGASLFALLAVGVALQFGCAFVGAWLLRWSYRVGEKCRSFAATASPRPALRLLFVVAPVSEQPRGSFRPSQDARAPPSVAWLVTGL